MRKLISTFVAGLALIALPGIGETATKDVTITVMPAPGGQPFITSYTLQNDSDNAMPAGSVYIAGQAFRRGDLPSGSHPVFRDPTTHVPLVQQLDDISHRTENADDGSIRQVVFSVQLPAPVPAHGTYTMEVVKEAGDYVMPAGKQTLANLCAAHGLKLNLGDVRNQDGTVRHGGHAVFNVCDAAGNTGRDAPRLVAQGPVRDTYIVRGAPVYDDGAKDPLLYFEAYVDLTTDPTDQTSLGPVRHVIRGSSPWMNVAAGSVGNAGAPGPAGFPNDPQAVSYRPTLLDGTSVLLDWSWWDNTVNSSANPVVINASHPGPTSCQSGPNGSGGFMNHDATSSGNIVLPGSLGINALQYGTALWYHTDGTPPAGLTNDHLYYTDGVGILYSGSDPNNTKYIHLASVPSACDMSTPSPEVNPTDQGTGDQTFSFRIRQAKWLHWFTVDQTAQENWTAGTSRTTSPLLPDFTQAELDYWKQTGAVPPLKLTEPVDTALMNHGSYEWGYYAPMAINNMGGLSGTGERPPLGLVSEHFAQAFLLETPEAWQDARVAALGFGSWTGGTILDERTARVPAYNNGPLLADHSSSGTPYTDGSLTIPLLAGTVDMFDGFTMDGLTVPLQGVPVAGYSGYTGGAFGASRHFSNDHRPGWANGVYQIFGSRYYLDEIYGNAAATVTPVSTGDQITHQTDTKNGIRYYGLHQNCCEVRGSWWATRDKMLGEVYGPDGSYERRMFHDMQQSNYWYVMALEAWEGAGMGSSFVLPSPEPFHASFKDSYGGMVDFQAYALAHDPLAAHFIPKLIAVYSGRCGLSSLTVGAYGDGYWCASYNWMNNFDDMSVLTGPYPLVMFQQNVGSHFVDDLSEMGESPSFIRVGSAADGTLEMVDSNGDFPNLFLSNGDKMKSIKSPQAAYASPDQLDSSVWYTMTNVITNPDGVIKSFKLIDPATGSPFSSFTLNGSPMIGGGFYLKARPTNASDSPATGFHSLGYTRYVVPMLRGFKALGYDVGGVLDNIVARGYTDGGGQIEKFSWDGTVVVP